MRNGYRIFDTHTHIGKARTGRAYSAEDLLRDMDRFGVERSLVMPFTVVEDWRAQHDVVGSAVRTHPDRMVGAACYHPSVSISEFRDEVRRCREEYGFRALKLQPQYHGLNPFSAHGNFLFETALETGMVVISHTGSGLPFSAPSLLMMPARRFPDLTIVAAHCGGSTFVQEAIVAAVYCPNIFLELSTLMPYHVMAVLAEVPADRLMIGSDLPENLDVEMDKILSLQIEQQSRRSILSGTANRVFLGAQDRS